MKPLLCLITVASMMLSPLPTSGADAGREQKPRFKGVELYSWKDKNGDWAFVLVSGTNRLKTEKQVKAAKSRIMGAPNLEAAFARLAKGEQVFWVQRINGFSFPPQATIAQLKGAAKRVGIDLHVAEQAEASLEPLWEDDKFTREQPWPGKVISVRPSWVGYGLLISDLKTGTKLCSVGIDVFGSIVYQELKGEAKKAALADRAKSGSYATTGVVNFSPGIDIGIFSSSLGPQTIGRQFGEKDLLLVASRQQHRQGMDRARRVQPPTRIPVDAGFRPPDVPLQRLLPTRGFHLHLARHGLEINGAQVDIEGLKETIASTLALVDSVHISILMTKEDGVRIRPEVQRLIAAPGIQIFHVARRP
ncbi:MAG: hypothetical protein OER86_02740 [Phycisphaerae bacterium]|nr:hypothetical protein [Phycisphaerae bacterium]